MKILRNFKDFCIVSDETLHNALKKIDTNKQRTIFVINQSGVLEGVLTDGDFRRALIQNPSIKLEDPVLKVANKKFFSLPNAVSGEIIQKSFSERITAVPLLDESSRLVGIAFENIEELVIDDFVISRDGPSYIIAEIGNNHNGSIDRAKRLVSFAKEAGANCAKFQMRSMRQLYNNGGNAGDAKEDLGSQYTLDLLAKYNLSFSSMAEVFDHCRKVGITPLCTPWDKESLDFLEEYGMQAYKVASADMTNHTLLLSMVATGKPLIVSTGMSTEQEIKESTDLLNRHGASFVLLQCNSTYPTPFKDINLQYMKRLGELGDCLVGYSGHERGISVPIAAVALGAKVIEKHFTEDRELEGNDHKVSLLPKEFADMVTAIRQVEESMGTSGPRSISQGERLNRETLAKSLIINCNLEKGQIIREDMIEIKSPGVGLQPNRKAQLIGKLAPRSFKAGEYFYESDLSGTRVEPRAFDIKRAWGIPIRYHDFKSLIKNTNLNLVEFHLSYKDMELDPGDFITRSETLDFVVHAPELFSNDHVLDLCSPNESYRKKSVENLKMVVNVTKKLKAFFPRTKRPQVIVNCGGFTMDKPIGDSEKGPMYKLIAENLRAIGDDEIEFIPQTMPPFPWHFGGQRFHNLFVSGEDIESFCRNEHFRICFDISHSKLACAEFGWSFSKFSETVLPYTAHLHIVDAKGSDHEGLQIGEGDIDFEDLAARLNRLAPKASFIPEIWQGHKNDGEGFWVAMNRLERWL